MTASQPDQTNDYARRVFAGEIVAGPHVRNACKRHLDDLERGHERGLVWRVGEAERAIGFFADVLKLSGSREFEGVAFVLQPWQAFVIGSVFGWYGGSQEDPDAKYRRFRVLYAETGKGNGKSPLMAGLGHLMLAFDGEPRAEVYAAATTRDQAMNLFRSAVAMVDLSPALNRRLLKTGGRNCYQISHIDSGSFFKCLASEDAQSGRLVHCALLDELHEHKSSMMFDMMRAGTKGRKQALIAIITNSGFDRTSACYAAHEYSEQVVSRVIENDTWFAYVCGLDEGDEPLKDESCWIKANPNLGVSITHTYVRDQVREAQGMPSKESEVRRLNFCEWVDAENPWIEGDVWLKCEDKTIESPATQWEGRDCVGALDLSGTNDLTALALAFKRADGGIDAFVELWTPKDTLNERSRRDRVPFDVWEANGHLRATPGRSVNYSFVAQRISELQAVFNFRRLAFDPYRIVYFERDLANAGVEMELVPHGQGFYRSQQSNLWMPRSIELIEKQIFEHTLHVLPNPCLRWNVASAVMEKDAKNNRAFDKRKAAGRIDGAVALAMAVGLLMDAAPEDEASVYETRGMIVV